MKINIFWEEKKEAVSLPEDINEPEIRKVAKTITSDLALRGKELNIIFCSPNYIRKLAQRYLKKDYIPASLSFPFKKDQLEKSSLSQKGFLGEVYLNYAALKNFPFPYLLRHAISRLIP